MASDTLSIACVIVRDDLSQLDEVKERESEVLDLKWLSISKVSFTITYIVFAGKFEACGVPICKVVCLVSFLLGPCLALGGIDLYWNVLMNEKRFEFLLIYYKI